MTLNMLFFELVQLTTCKQESIYPSENPAINFPMKKAVKVWPAHCVIVPIVCIIHAIKTNFFLPTLSPIGPDSCIVRIKYHVKIGFLAQLTIDVMQDAANGTDSIIALFELLSNENVF